MIDYLCVCLDAGGEQADSAPQPEAEQQTEEQPAAVEPAAEPVSELCLCVRVCLYL